MSVSKAPKASKPRRRVLLAWSKGSGPSSRWEKQQKLLFADEDARPDGTQFIVTRLVKTFRIKKKTFGKSNKRKKIIFEERSWRTASRRLESERADQFDV